VSRAALRPKRVSHFLSHLNPGHMSYSGQTGARARRDDSRCTWSGSDREVRGEHAASRLICANIGHISVTALAAQIQVLCIAALFGLGPGPRALLRSRWTQLRR
jgi:hypothetical protein